MGTRHLICVVKNDEFKVAQYGQWDGYPEGEGKSILRFLKSDLVGALKDNLVYCKWYCDYEIEKLWQDLGVEPGQRLIKFEVVQEFDRKYPQLSRDTGSNILDIIAHCKGEIKLRDEYDFSRDSLMCEWAYVIDFDKNSFEVYRGYNKKPLDRKERFYSNSLCHYESGKQYYPIKLLVSFDLSNLPAETEFIEVCNSEMEKIESEENTNSV